MPDDTNPIQTLADDTSSQQDTGSSSFGKGGKFGMGLPVMEAPLPKQQEAAPLVQPERIIKPEIIRTPEQQPRVKETVPSEAPQKTAPVQPQPIKATDNKPKEQKKENKKLHPVGPHADKLTTIADKDEEDFILEVEAVHEHN